MSKLGSNKKSLKELRGELLTNRNGPCWQSNNIQKKDTNVYEQSSSQDNEEIDEEDMGM